MVSFLFINLLEYKFVLGANIIKNPQISKKKFVSLIFFPYICTNLYNTTQKLKIYVSISIRNSYPIAHCIDDGL